MNWFLRVSSKEGIVSYDTQIVAELKRGRDASQSELAVLKDAETNSALLSDLPLRPRPQNVSTNPFIGGRIKSFQLIIGSHKCKNFIFIVRAFDLLIAVGM